MLAHLGHWYVGGPVFLGPVILLALAIKFTEWRQRRRVGEQRSEVRTTWDADRAVIAITGRLDWTAVSELEAELAVVAARGVSLAILDLRTTTSIEDGATARMVELQDDSRSAGVEWALIAARPAVQVSLELSGITDLAPVVDAPGDVETGQR